MTRAVAEGYPKRLIEEAATRRQAAVDRGEAVIVGVNRYVAEDEAPIDFREIDNAAVLAAQLRRLAETRRRRSVEAVRGTLDALEAAARAGGGNLLEAAVAARARATVGEISDALRAVFGDHVAVPEVVGDIYGKAYEGDPEMATLRGRLADFAGRTGAAPRILVAKLGQDGHDRGAKIIASAFGDIGFEVVAGPLFQTPDEAAELALREGVHVVGVSSLAAGHKVLLPQLVEALKARGAGHVVVVCGGVVPRQDHAFLIEHGVSAVFGPGTNVMRAGRAVLDLLDGRLRNTSGG